jgi:hypothetical protein
MSWVILMLVVGAALPLLAALAVVLLSRHRAPAADAWFGRALALGIVYGTVGGLAVSALTVALALLIRHAR